MRRMDFLNQILLILHFLGLAMGLSVSFSGMVMQGLMAKAAPQERQVLARFPPRMVIVGHAGLGLLWLSGLALVYTKWGGFAVLPWQFHVKLTAVVLLTIVVGYITRLIKKAAAGDQAAVAQVQAVGKVAFLLAVTAITFAVLTFD
jgi:uncharacterized membrane protein